MKTFKEKLLELAAKLKPELEVKNVMALPHLEKVVVNIGVGKTKDKKRLELIADRLAKITGQKAAPRGSKKSIAGFKVREGDVVGLSATLRGDRMYGFLAKLFQAAMPRIRDFRGFDEKIIDEMGNLSLGLREHTIFPETADEDIKDVFGMTITIVTTAKNRREALAFFRAIGFPFKKK